MRDSLPRSTSGVHFTTTDSHLQKGECFLDPKLVAPVACLHKRPISPWRNNVHQENLNRIRLAFLRLVQAERVEKIITHIAKTTLKMPRREGHITSISAPFLYSTCIPVPTHKQVPTILTQLSTSITSHFNTRNNVRDRTRTPQ